MIIVVVWSCTFFYLQLLPHFLQYLKTFDIWLFHDELFAGFAWFQVAFVSLQRPTGQWQTWVFENLLDLVNRFKSTQWKEIIVIVIVIIIVSHSDFTYLETSPATAPETVDSNDVTFFLSWSDDFRSCEFFPSVVVIFVVEDSLDSIIKIEKLWNGEISKIAL